MEKSLILTSFHYHQRLSRSKLCFMSTMRQSLSSVIYQNLIILHTGNAVQAHFYFSTAALPLKCELQTSQACLAPSLPPALCCFHSPCFIPFFLSTSYFIYCSLPDTYTLFSPSFALPCVLFALCPLKMLPSGVRQIPDIPGSRLMTARES